MSAPAAPRRPASGSAPPRVSRGEARNEAVRATLQPLGPDERPVALLIAIAISALLGAGNLVAYAAGMEVEGRRPGFFGVALLSVLLLVAAAGMWQKRYWAVLGFQAILGITVILSSLALLFAGNLAAVAVSVVIAGLGGWLFWRLVRIMARIQMPSPPGAGGAIR